MSLVGAVILAAGASARMGEPKQILMLGEETLLERSIRVAEEAGCRPVVVVLGAHAEQIRERCRLAGSDVVVNSDWAKGMGTSISLGVQSLHHVEGAVVMTCDMPAVTARHLQMLMATGEATASGYMEQRGVPAYLPRSMFPLLIQLQGDTGARELLRSVQVIELPGGELDVDTMQDVIRVRELFS